MSVAGCRDASTNEWTEATSMGPTILAKMVDKIQLHGKKHDTNKDA